MLTKIVDGEIVLCSLEEEEEILAERAAAKVIQDKNKYKDARHHEYGSANDQLDFIVNNGLEAFIARNKAIKAKYPKSE